MKTPIEQLNAESERKRREKKSFETAGDGFVIVKMNGEQHAVDPATLTVDGVKLGDILTRLTDAEKQGTATQGLVDGLTHASKAQSQLLEQIINTLKGVKL
jgi:hypothetical protein